VTVFVPSLIQVRWRANCTLDGSKPDPNCTLDENVAQRHTALCSPEAIRGIGAVPALVSR